MSKLTRALVLGAMLAVLSSATAAVAQPPTGITSDPVQEFRAGERASQSQPVSTDTAVQRFRAGERASQGQPVSTDEAVQRFRAGERISQPVTAADGGSSVPAQNPERGTPVVLLGALLGAAVLALSLDALSIRRKSRKAAARAAI
jgi:hypothetical protein